MLAALPGEGEDLAEPCRSLAITGLVGEAAGIELQAWLRDADLPDAGEVLAAPTSIDWGELRPDQVYAILSGTTGLATHDGTAEAVLAGLHVLAAAAQAGRGDVAVPFTTALLAVRPDGPLGIPPALLAPLLPIVRDAGLLVDVSRPDAGVLVDPS